MLRMVFSLLYVTEKEKHIDLIVALYVKANILTQIRDVKKEKKCNHLIICNSHVNISKYQRLLAVDTLT